MLDCAITMNNPIALNVLHWFDVAWLAGLVASIYVAGAAVCRIRHPSFQLRHAWKLLYLLVFSNALWTSADILMGRACLRDMAVAAAVAFYVWLTKAAWQHGVPSIATPSAQGGK